METDIEREKRGDVGQGRKQTWRGGGGGKLETKQTWREKDRQTNRDRDEDKQKETNEDTDAHRPIEQQSNH